MDYFEIPCSGFHPSGHRLPMKQGENKRITGGSSVTFQHNTLVTFEIYVSEVHDRKDKHSNGDSKQKSQSKKACMHVPQSNHDFDFTDDKGKR